MKKILAMAMVLILVFSLGSITVAAEADGTEGNPYQVSSMGDVPMAVTVPAGSTVWYNFDSMTFNGMKLQATFGLSAITVDGTVFEPSMAMRGMIEAQLNARAASMMVGFVNDTEYDATSYLTLVAPTGTEATPFELFEGDNEVVMDESVIFANGYIYYMAFNPNLTATYTFTASNAAATETGFELVFDGGATVYADDDGDGVITFTMDLESYSPIKFFAGITGMDIPVIALNIAGPAAGSAARPIEVYDESGLEAPFTVPAGESLYLNLYDFSGTGLVIDGAVSATVDGEEVDGFADMTKYTTSVVLTNNGEEEAEVALSIEYPIGHANNPEGVWNGDVALQTNAGRYSYMYTYTALGDGTLTVTPSDKEVIDNINLSNESAESWEDWTYATLADWTDDYSEFIKEDSVSIEVKKGDTVTVEVTAPYDDETIYKAMDLTVTFDGPEAPVGHPTNPGVAVDGDNALSVPAGSNAEGYFMLYTATADGKLTVTFGTLDKLAGIAIADYEMDNSVEQVGTEITDGVLTMDVKKGEKYWIALLPASADALDTTVDVDLEVPVVDDDKDDDKKEDDKTDDKPASPVTGPITGAGIALVVAAASGAYVFLNKKR